MAEIKMLGATLTFVKIFYKSQVFAALVFSLLVVWFGFLGGGVVVCFCFVLVLFVCFCFKAAHSASFISLLV